MRRELHEKDRLSFTFPKRGRQVMPRRAARGQSGSRGSEGTTWIRALAVVSAGTPKQGQVSRFKVG